MRWIEIKEGRDAPLYHATSLARAVKILNNGNFISNFSDKNNSTISTTRDPRLRYYSKDEEDIVGIAPIQFVLDQTKISNRYKIEPFDFWDGAGRWPTKDQNEKSGGVRSHEAEEIIRTKHLPISYITEIWLMPLDSDYFDNASTDELNFVGAITMENIKKSYDSLISLAKKYNIPVIDKRAIKN